MKHKKNILYLTLSFLLPLSLLAIGLSFQQIWIHSERTILASDGFHQYVIFHQQMRNILHGDGSLFYTFTSGLGLNFYALISYYLGSPFSFLTVFFTLESMPDALYLFALIKIGLTGLSSFYAFHKLYPTIHKNLILAFSSSAALLSFTISQIEINTWLDVFILIPLILLGLVNILRGEKSYLYFISLTLLFIQNYYFGYMTGLFLILWTMLQLSWDFKGRIKYIFRLISVSVLAFFSSMIMLLPTIIDLRSHGEKFSSILRIKTESSWYLDIFAKNLVGAYDTTKYGSIPSVYIGLLSFLIAFTFFTIKSIKWQVKVTYALVITFIITSFYLQPLDLFWQGMHAPNMFLHRYSWLFSILVLHMALEAISRFKELSIWRLTLSLFPPLFGFILTYCFKEHYPFLNQDQFIFTGEFLVSYILLLLTLHYKKLSFSIFSILITFFVVIELGINTVYQLNGIKEDWNFPTRQAYQEQLTEIDKLVNYTKIQNKDFFRMEQKEPQTGNDSMKYNYNGISQFSSVRNRSSSSLLDRLGFKSSGTNLNLRYQNNTILADSLFAIRYNLSRDEINKFGFDLVKKEGKTYLYKNQYALPLAFKSKGIYQDIPISTFFLENQESFLNQIAQKNNHYYQTLPILTSSLENKPKENKNPFQLEASEKKQFTVLVPSNSQLYLSLPNLTFIPDTQKNIQITVGQKIYHYKIDNSFSFFDLGAFDKEEKIKIEIEFPDSQSVNMGSVTFFSLDTNLYKETFQEINNNPIRTRTEKNSIYSDYQSEQPTSILYTLPYDKGWSASLNGKSLPITPLQNGLMKVDVPSGSGTIHLQFTPQGFYLGAAMSLLGLSTYLLVIWMEHKKRTLK